MEATTAESAPAGTESQQSAEAGGEEAVPDIGQWQQSVDQQLAAANDTIRQMADGFQSFQETVTQRLPEPEAAPNFEEQFNELFEQSGGYVEPQQLQSLVQQQIQQGVQEAIAPLQQELGEFRSQMTAQELQGLQNQFPELQDQKTLEALADKVVDTAIQVAPRGMPPQLIESLTENKEFVALVHLAEKARGAAREETPAGQGQTVPHIESGGGAAPSSTGGGDEWDSFLQSRKGGSVFG